MNVNKNIGFLIVLATALLLLLGGLVFLWLSYAGFREARDGLYSRRAQLDDLIRYDPYPNTANVKRTRENLDVVRQATTELVDRLRAGQTPAQPIESAQFPPRLERSTRELHNLAKNAQITLPIQFAFGFERYVRGELPELRHVSRLVNQLEDIRSICRLLFDVRISELKRISRPEFEATPQMDTPSGSATRNDTDFPFRSEWYDRERYEVEFLTRESALWELIRRLARTPRFIVLSRLDVKAPRPNRTALLARMNTQAASRQSAVPDTGVLSHEERVVAGREPILVNCTLDFYWFRPMMAEEVVE